MAKIYLCLLLSIGAVAQSADVKKWVDSAGNIHYGSIPPTGANAKVVEIHKDPEPSPAEKLKRDLAEIKYKSELAKQELERRRHAEDIELSDRLREIEERSEQNRADYNQQMCTLYERWIEKAKDELNDGYTVREGEYYERKIREYEEDKQRYCR